MKRIYLDYAATSPVKPEVFEAMKPYFMENFGNPSSIHWFGRCTRGAIDKARQTVAEFLNCMPEEIIFTSGGTESDNLAIRGTINSKFQFEIFNEIQNLNVSNIKNSDIDLKLKIKNLNLQKPHIITSQFEHHAVLETCKDLGKQGLAEVTYIKPDRDGIVSCEDVKKAIKPNTVLISIMYVNNEIGTVQPIPVIGKWLFEKRKLLGKKKMENGKMSNFQFPISKQISNFQQQISKIYFHTDAVQAIEYQEMDVQKLGVDMLSLSAHKFGGPKGIGILYVKKGTPLSAIQTGGEQEWRKRAGTENVAGIVGLEKAIELLAPRSKDVHSIEASSLNSDFQWRLRPTFDRSARIRKLSSYLINEIIKKIPDVSLNGSKEKRNPNNVNLSFKYIEGEAILLNLDLAGIAASSGSACTSGSLEPSHVLLSIGLKHEDAHGSVRFTLGEETTKEEIDYTVKILVKIVKKLRKMSPFGK